MRYEKPEVVVIGKAETVVLGGMENPVAEHIYSSIQSSLVGYDE